MKRVSAILPSLLLAILILAGWEAACRITGVAVYLLPPPSAIWAAMVENLPILLQSALVTLSMAAQALAAALVVATPLALAGALSPLFQRATGPLAAAIQVTPVVAIAPLFVIWAGLDHPDRAITALGAIVAFFPIFSGLSTGLRAADPDLQRLFDLYGATRLQRLIRLSAPSAIPYLVEGIKVAAGLSIIGVVVAEFVAGSGGSQGLAWRILEAEHQLKTAQMFAALVVLGLLGAALNGLLTVGERRLLKTWRGR
jgi:NitT/TauT family transport system permease protein